MLSSSPIHLVLSPWQAMRLNLTVMHFSGMMTILFNRLKVTWAHIRLKLHVERDDLISESLSPAEQRSSS